LRNRFPIDVPNSTWIFFILLHIPLAFILKYYPLMSAIHAILVLIFGLYFAFLGKMEKIAIVGAYIMGAEVLWRMSDAPIFHEYAKYASSLIFIIGILRKRNFKISGLAIMYFALMVPSILLVVTQYEFPIVRDLLSFNLSGPLALMISVIFFINCRFTPRQLNRILFAGILPIVSIATISLYLIVTNSGITYDVHSAYARSGDYAPNQVSAILGLGALLIYIILVKTEKIAKNLQIVLLFILLWFAAQSSLTYSRTGLISTAASIIVVTLFLFFDRSGRKKAISILFPLIIIGSMIILPNLIDLTSGTIVERFTNLDPTGRETIAQGDLLLWRDNFLFGVGPGVSSRIRPLGVTAASHTEFTRVLADHGLLGLLSNIVFLIMVFYALKNAQGIMYKGLATCFIVWSIILMSTNGMRLFAPSYFIGLIFAFRYIQSESFSNNPNHLVRKAIISTKVDQSRY